MLRMAAVARAVLRRRQLPISMAAAIPSHGTHLPAHLPPSISRPPVSSSRCYARMARRSPPPVRQNADMNEDSESEAESDFEEEEKEMKLFDGDDDDDGEESEEWEGFMMDFGSTGKKGGDDDNEEDKDGTS